MVTLQLLVSGRPSSAGTMTLLFASLIYNRQSAEYMMPLGNPVMPMLDGQLPHNPHAVKIDVMYPYNNKTKDGSILLALTGLPNSTLIFREIHELRQDMIAIKNQQDNVPMAVANKIRDLLDGRGIGGGVISMEDLNRSIKNQLEALPFI